MTFGWIGNPEMRGLEGESLYLTDLFGSDEFLQELSNCQNHYGVRPPALYDEIVQTAGVQDTVGYRIGEVGSTLLSLVGGAGAARALMGQVARTLPGVANTFARTPRWVGWGVAGSTVAAIAFPPIFRELQNAVRLRNFAQSEDANDLLDFRDPKNWADFYNKILDLRDLVTSHQGAGTQAEREAHLRTIICFVKNEMPSRGGSGGGTISPIERANAILHFFESEEELREL